MRMAEQVTEAEAFAASLNWYVTAVAMITQERSEPRLKEIDLPAEYRWEIDTGTDHLLSNPMAPFSAQERGAIEAFAAAVRNVPVSAPELDHPAWAKSQELGATLIPMLQSRLDRLRYPGVTDGS
jgi:hypothetical protein